MTKIVEVHRGTPASRSAEIQQQHHQAAELAPATDDLDELLAELGTDQPCSSGMRHR